MKLPYGWQVMTLDAICSGDLQTGPFGSQLHADEYVSDGIPVIMPKDIVGGRIVANTAARITPERAHQLGRHRLTVGDVIFSRRGDVARAGLVSETDQGFLCGTGCLRARPDKRHVLPSFLNLLVQSPQSKRWLESNAVGQTMPNMNTEILSQLTFKLPSLHEQELISAITSTWDAAIENTEKLIAAKSRQKAWAMASLLTAQKRLGGFRKSWRQWNLGNLFRERVEPNRGDLPLLSITSNDGVVPRAELDRKDTSSEDKSKYLRICPGDIGYNTMRMWQGVSALSRYEGIVSPAYTVCVPGPDIDGKFASYLFKLPEVIHLFYRYSQGLTSDTWNLKFQHFAEIVVRIPELDEQVVIASALATVDDELTLLKKQSDALVQQKRGLMQKLLSGQWRLSVLEEPS
jgi:type I restriction enzyme S subunit